MIRSRLSLIALDGSPFSSWISFTSWIFWTNVVNILTFAGFVGGSRCTNA